jgi:ATP-binding cassette subfamily B protein
MNNDKKFLISFIYSYYRKYPIYLFFIFLISFLLGTYNVIDGYFKKNLFSLLSDQSVPLDEIIGSINLNVFFIIFFYIINHFYWRSLNFIEIKIGHKVKNSIIKTAFERIHSQSYQFFQNNLSGSLSHNILVLADNIQILVHKYLSTFIRAFFQTIFVLCAIYIVNPVFTIILSAWIVIFVSFSVFFLKKFRIASKDYAEISAKTSGRIVDSIANFLNVKLFASIFFEKVKLKDSLGEMEKKFQRKNIILLIINAFQAFSIAISFGLTIFFAVKLKLAGSISIPQLIFVLTLFFHISENIWWVSEYIGLVNEIFGKCNAALDKIFSPNDLIDSHDSKNIDISKGEIEFQNVDFAYQKSNKLIFHNLSIKIQAGKKIGLVGYSGSGKSTFINLILRLYDVNSGKILIDGNELKDFTQDSLRSQISVIPQEPFLFHRTIFENLEYGLVNQESLNNEEKKQKILYASEVSKSKNFIENLKDQYDSFVGERGVKLSGGQKQRIAIARAVLKNSQILILDEATSALDSVTEFEIQENFLKIMDGKTVIVIAHRLSTLMNMDEILVFKDGSIVQRGAHSDLVKDIGGHYKELWDAQIGGFLGSVIEEKIH